MNASRVDNAQGGNIDAPSEMKDNANSPVPDADDPYIFKHAPPKPDGDPWEILLKPELEADTARCNAWKDEVQNLLIFAGLFSAVVTGLVIESYKFLQPDPNAAIIGLLFHIANILNSTQSSTLPYIGPTLQSITTPFPQTSSSVRINVFWFISLILSLTTVLVGTISLQWLREHQSYPNFSPKEKLAILHMRSQALDGWYVPLMFSTLPLLLQCAVILFLAGLIDFSLPLGADLTIPISLIIFLTLLFLGTTTVLPAFQGLFFLFSPNLWTTIPTPCPFKSPQSHAIRTLSGYILRVFSYIFSTCYLPEHLDLDKKRWKELPLHQHQFFPFIYTIWHQKTWLTFDWEWLYLRDACRQSVLDHNPDLVDHREAWYTSKAFPLSDLTQCIIKATTETPTAKYMEAFLGATVHCFQELSDSIWVDNLQHREHLRQNDYFERLYQQRSTCSISKLLLTRAYKIQEDSPKSTITPRSYNQDQMFHFLNLIHGVHRSPKLRQYQQELWSQIMSTTQIAPLVSTSYNSSPSIPTLLEWSIINSIIPKAPGGFSDQTFTAIANMLGAVFKSAASHRTSQDQSMDFLCTHSQMAVVIFWLANWTNDYSEWVQRNASTNTANQHLLECDGTHFISTFEFVSKRLNTERSNISSQEDAPSVLFYLAAIFMWKLLYGRAGQKALQDKDNSRFDQGLRSLLEAILQYRTWTRTSGWKNNTLEMRFKNEDYSLWKRKRRMNRFSDEWWGILFEHGRNIGLKAAEQGSTLSEGSAPKSHPVFSSRETDAQENMLDIITIIPSSTPTSCLVEDPSSASNASVLNGNTVNHIKGSSRTGSRPASFSDSPSITNHAAMTDEVLDPIANASLSRLQPSPLDPHESWASDGNHTDKDATLQGSPSALPLPSTSLGTSTVTAVLPQQLAGNITGNGRALNHADESHFTIEVGWPNAMEQIERVEIARSGGSPTQDQATGKDVVVRVESQT